MYVRSLFRPIYLSSIALALSVSPLVAGALRAQDEDGPKPITEDQRKDAESSGKTLLRDKDGKLSEVKFDTRSCTVYWYDCSPPHSIQYYTLTPGQTLYYHDWGFSGPCVFRTYYCASGKDDKTDAKPLSADERKDARFSETKMLLRNERGVLSEVKSQRGPCTVFWYDCKPPHSIQSYTLTSGQTLYYHDWGFSGPCTFKTYYCARAKKE